MSTVKRYLVDLRKGRFRNQASAAAAIGVSQMTLSRWETTDAEPRPAARPAYAAALGLTLAELGAAIYDPSSVQSPAAQASPAGVEG